MTTAWGLRIASIALALGFAAAPAVAQNATAPVNASEAIIGPPQLEGFSLDGTVTRRAEPTTPVQQPPRPGTTAPEPAATSSTNRQQAARQPGPEPEPQPGEREQAPSGPSQSASTIPADVRPTLPSFPAPLPGAGEAAAFAQPVDASAPVPDLADEPSGFPTLPWIVALLAAAGAAGWYFLRQRPRLALAGGASEFVAPEPEPEPLRRVPVAKPPAQPKSDGVVSTALRPSIEVAFSPSRAVFSDEGMAIEFDLSIVNSGNAPARDLLVEAVMLNAGPAQNQEIGAFFEHPVGRGERVAAVAPLSRLALRSSVALKIEQLQGFKIDDRTLCVPVVAFNVLYRSAAGESQRSAAWIVGRDTKAAKLAPFRLDTGPRLFRGLGARQLDLTVSK